MFTVGGRIRAWREGAGWSQRELAERLGVTQAAIHNWESGQRQPSLRMLSQIARAFGRSRDELLEGTEPVDIDQPPVDLLQAAGYAEDVIASLVESWSRQPATFRSDVVQRAQRRAEAAQELAAERAAEEERLRGLLDPPLLVV